MYSPATAQLGSVPRASLAPFQGARSSLELMAKLALGQRGEKSAVVRRFTEWVVGDIWPKDYLGEILAIRNVLVSLSPWKPGVPIFRYANDPTHVEWVKDPERMVEEIMEHGSTVVDCDEQSLMAATMLLQIGRKPEYVALGFKPGHLTHVGLRVQEPKSGQWIWIDSVAGPRERQAAANAKEIRTWSLD